MTLRLFVAGVHYLRSKYSSYRWHLLVFWNLNAIIIDWESINSWPYRPWKGHWTGRPPSRSFLIVLVTLHFDLLSPRRRTVSTSSDLLIMIRWANIRRLLLTHLSIHREINECSPHVFHVWSSSSSSMGYDQINNNKSNRPWQSFRADSTFDMEYGKRLSKICINHECIAFLRVVHLQK